MSNKVLQDEYAFFNFLWFFYVTNRKKIRATYRKLSINFLDYNDPSLHPHRAFLRRPQFEALEVYVFLKEFLNNAKVEEVFQDWFNREGQFRDRDDSEMVNLFGQQTLFEDMTQKQYETLFSKMLENSREYANYIFALTMGTGKTILMATCIFYEFVLANKWPKDKNYCHNVLVFAPDKTVLQSLKEIQTFDFTKVVPPEYYNFLSSNIRFHFLEEAGTALSTIDNSRFNVIISNTQKIILKRQNKAKTPIDRLFETRKETVNINDKELDELDAISDLYDFDITTDDDLTTNQRFDKLTRLEQLGIFVDEAHHAFGENLAKDVGSLKDKRLTSLRLTIDMLAQTIAERGSRVVACYNFTGTPYVKKEVLPEVVYSYGLREAINEGYLKLTDLRGYENPKSEEFLRIAVLGFLESIKDLTPENTEGLLPKMAIFATTIDEVRNELKPALEKILSELGISSSTILVNLGDTETTNDDIREFNNLDKKNSEKQFILLVNKGREGWNCRSLFGVTMFRSPKSKIFVLQATMRCLRSIGNIQNTASIFLSKDNLDILNDELEQNFKISVTELNQSGAEKEVYKIKVLDQPKLKLQRVRRNYQVKTKELVEGLKLLPELDKKEEWYELIKGYKLIEIRQEGLLVEEKDLMSKSQIEDVTHYRSKIFFSSLMLVAEISRYLNESPLKIESILSSTSEGIKALLTAVNEYNEVLYDYIIPRLFSSMYDVFSEDIKEEYEIELVKIPPNGDFYEVRALPEDVVKYSDIGVLPYRDKSFHLDTYCFDSNPEQGLFWHLLKSRKVKKLYFTGMLTHGQSDFYIQYVDPETNRIRHYYPDFLFQKEDGSYVIVEVKGDHMIDDSVVKAKAEYTKLLAEASNMEYQIIKGTDVDYFHDQLF